jgi:hypothetical protein
MPSQVFVHNLLAITILIAHLAEEMAREGPGDYYQRHAKNGREVFHREKPKVDEGAARMPRKV